MDDNLNGAENKKTNTEESNNGIDRDTLGSQQGEKTDKEENKGNQEGIPQEEKADESQAQASPEETQCDSQEIQDPLTKEDSSRPKRDGRDGKKRKKRGIGTGLIVAIVSVCVVVSMLAPYVMGISLKLAADGITWLGNTLYNYYQTQTGGGDDSFDDDEINVIKNDGSIDVNVEVGSTGNKANMTVSEVVKLVADSVVEITTSHVVTDRFYHQYVTSGAGSGVIISENGYIITNNHVIEGATDITVRLTDGRTFSARFIGGDAKTDVAVIKIQTTGLTFAKMGSSKNLVVGQDVIAIGNPLGSLGGTVTDGIISALDRTVTVDGTQMTLMQTNAAINPGNSGGGLFDMAGQLIGIVNAKQSDTGIEGLGFAIPIDVAWASAERILSAKQNAA